VGKTKGEIMPRIGERGWIHSGVKVVDNAAAPTSWTDLDLSAVVGKNRVLAFLKIENTDSISSETFYFRRGDDTENVGAGGLNAGGNSIIKLSSLYVGHILMETDVDGIIEWKSGIGSSTNLWVLGYIR